MQLSDEVKAALERHAKWRKKYSVEAGFSFDHPYSCTLCDAMLDLFPPDYFD